MLILDVKCCLYIKRDSLVGLLYFDHCMGLCSLNFNLPQCYSVLSFVVLKLSSVFHLEKDHDVFDTLMRNENFETHELLYMQIN